MSIESKIKEVSKRYGSCKIYVLGNKFKIVTGNYHPEETYTSNYETVYYDKLIDALNAFISGKKTLQK